MNTENKTDVEQQKDHYWRSLNILKKEDISFEDRYVLLCIIRGLQQNGNISKISLDAISRKCAYTDTNGNYHPFGRKKIDPCIERLEKAGKIKVIKGSLGQCTQYQVNGLKSYEKVPDAFFSLPYSPAEKGYLLYMLQHNKNKDKKHNQPNKETTKTKYSEMELLRTSHMEKPDFDKIEKTFIKDGILKLTPTTQRDPETGLTLTERSINLDAINMGSFVLQVATTITNQMDEFEKKVNETFVKKEDFEKLRDLLETVINPKN